MNRLSIDGILWTPALVSTAAWYDVGDRSTIGTTVTNTVSSWNDKSGNNNHATQSNTAKRPLLKLSDPLANNFNSIGYGVDDGTVGMDLPSFTANNVYTVCYYKDGVTDTFTSGKYPSIIAGSESSGTKRLAGNSGLSTWRLISSFHWYAGGSYRWNSVDYTSTNTALPQPLGLYYATGTTIPTQTRTIGYNNPAGAGYQWNGAYSEIIFTAGTDSTATRQKIEGYLAWKWLFVDKLPVTHPYKLRPPRIGD